MAKELEEVELCEEHDTLNYILDFMDDIFDGDLAEASDIAASKLTEEGLIEELWQEIGHKVLAREYREGRLIKERNEYQKHGPSTADGKEKNVIPPHSKGEGAKQMKKKKGGLSQWYYDPVNKRWSDLMSFRKQSVKAAAELYDKRARANAIERDFLMRVQSELGENQQVSDVFTREEIIQIKEEIKNNN